MNVTISVRDDCAGVNIHHGTKDEFNAIFKNLQWETFPTFDAARVKVGENELTLYADKLDYEVSCEKHLPEDFEYAPSNTQKEYLKAQRWAR